MNHSNTVQIQFEGEFFGHHVAHYELYQQIYQNSIISDVMVNGRRVYTYLTVLMPMAAKDSFSQALVFYAASEIYATAL